MHLIDDLAPLTESQLLDHAEAVAEQRRRCEVQELKVAVHHAMNNHDKRPAEDRDRLPGRERPRLFGGPGTPFVGNFAPGTLGARLGISTTAASSLIADALDLVMRFPRLWDRVEKLEVKASYARYVARRTRELPLEQCELIDELVAEPADGRVPWTRFEQIVDGAIVSTDPEAARAREELADKHVSARRTRGAANGVRGFHIRAQFPIIALLDARITWFAEVLKALGDERGHDERRVAAVAILADPAAAVELMRRFQEWRDRPEDPDESGDWAGAQPRTGDAPEVDWSKILPTVRLFLHYYPGQGPPSGGDPPGDERDRKWTKWKFPPPKTGTVVRTEGHGPVTTDWVRNFLGKHARFTITPVLDLAGQAPVDAYEIPQRHRHAVHLMTPADTFPWGSSTSRRMEIDHTVPFVHGPESVGAGQSRVGNYGPMSGFHHRLKTHGGWQVQQPYPGIYVWRDPHGAFYLVDHTGARRLASPQRHNVSQVEWAFHDLIVEYDLTA